MTTRIVIDIEDDSSAESLLWALRNRRCEVEYGDGNVSIVADVVHASRVLYSKTSGIDDRLSRIAETNNLWDGS